jgi:hypothetical protein
MTGGRPWSWIKITLLILAVLIVFMIYVYLDNS